jgi:cellulose synthase/poly-beta-1,6-N-acetylglucosamine synthase-like glycosyltransferase
MGKSISIVVPTYKRTDNIIRTFEDLKDLDAKIFFVCHETDKESLKMLQSLRVEIIIDTQTPSGVNATNAGYWGSDGDLVVIGQDDFKWHDGWLEEALRVMNDTGAKVVGLNDGFIGRHEHSVGWLLDRKYVEKNSLSIGHPNVIFNPDYVKNFSDNELNDTAKFRKVWAYAESALCEHLHPSFGKGKTDETYERPDKHFSEDFMLYHKRKHLFGI